jgi:hypothetical protein
MVGGFEMKEPLDYGNGKGVVAELKDYECVEVKNHEDVGKTIEQWQKNGWRLHTYTCAQYGIGGDVHHHLLLEKDG